MCGSRVCNFSFLLFLTCLSTGRVSGQGRPGQEVVTFLPQGDILYEISTVYTNQNTKAIITVVANGMITWSVRDSTVSTVGCQILIPLPVCMIDCLSVVDIRMYDFHRDPCCCLRSHPPLSGARCGRKLQGLNVYNWSLTPQLLLAPGSRAMGKWANQGLHPPHATATDNLSRNQCSGKKLNEIVIMFISSLIKNTRLFVLH